MESNCRARGGGNLGCGMATSVVSNQPAPPCSLIGTAVRARLVLHFQWDAYYWGGEGNWIVACVCVYVFQVKS